MSEKSDSIPLFESRFFKYRKTDVHYLRFGTGDKHLIAFHGFADKADLFKVLEPSLRDTYTVYAVDLPFHGKTEWPDKAFGWDEVVEMVNYLKSIEEFERFSLMGFSMGGRIALSIASEYVQVMDELFLIAASGIKYYSATEYMPTWMIRSFKGLVNNPMSYFQLLKMLQKLKLLGDKRHRLIRRLTDTKTRRRRVYFLWLSIRHFDVNVEGIKKLLNRNDVKVHLIWGKKDRIVPIDSAYYFQKKLESCELHVLSGGHLIVNERLNDLLRKILHNDASLY